MATRIVNEQDSIESKKKSGTMGGLGVMARWMRDTIKYFVHFVLLY